MRSISILLAALALVAISASAQAQFTQIDLSSQFNADIQTYTNGGNYQSGGTQLTVAGVPFSLGQLNSASGTTAAVQTPSDGQTHSYTFTLPAGTFATDLFTLANTGFGSLGTNEGSIVVTGTDGETATLNLTEGVNIRDHNNDGFVNTLSDPTVVPTYFVDQSPNSTSGPVRLDRQDLPLPASFAGDTIASITFNGIGNGDPDGSPFLAAATLAVVPEPTSLALLGLGIPALLARRRAAAACA